MATTPFDINKITDRYKNITKSNTHNPTFDYSFKMVDGIGNELAEIYYSSSFDEWGVIKDNFPGRRIGYKWSLPTLTFEDFEHFFKLMKLPLVINPNPTTL